MMSLLSPSAVVPEWIPMDYLPTGKGYQYFPRITEICAEMRYLESLGNWHNLEPESVAFDRYGAEVAKLAEAILHNKGGILDKSINVTELQPVWFDALSHLCTVSFDGIPPDREDRIMRIYGAVQRVRTLQNYWEATSRK